MFRHTTASLLIAGGADAVSTANWLGHSQVSTTMNIYENLMNNANSRNADILTTALQLEEKNA